MGTDSLVLLFTQHKNRWLAAITSQSLSCCITCHDVCAQQQCCHRLLYRNHSIHKKFNRSETNSLDLKFVVEVCGFSWNYVVIYFITLLPKNLCIICKFVKTAHAESWKMYQQSSDLLQQTKTTPHQWRSEAKCRPGPTIKVPAFPPLKFAYKNLKWKKIMFRDYQRYKE